jgi:hypothetical protein
MPGGSVAGHVVRPLQANYYKTSRTYSVQRTRLRSLLLIEGHRVARRHLPQEHIPVGLMSPVVVLLRVMRGDHRG